MSTLSLGKRMRQCVSSDEALALAFADFALTQPLRRIFHE